MLESYNYGDEATPVISTSTNKKTSGTSIMSSGDNSYSDNGMTLLNAKSSVSSSDNNLLEGTVVKKSGKVMPGMYNPYGFDETTNNVISQKTQEQAYQEKVDDAQNTEIKNIEVRHDEDMSAQTLTDAAQDERIDTNAKDIVDLKQGIIDIKAVGYDAGTF